MYSSPDQLQLAVPEASYLGALVRTGGRQAAKGGPDSALIISSDRHLLTVWAAAFSQAGCQVELETSMQRGVVRVGESAMPLVVIDALDRAGVDAIRALRERGDPASILATTAVGDSDTIVAAIDAGADACVSRACTGRELVVRARALVRRPRPRPRLDDVWHLEDLRIDPAARSVAKGEDIVPLSPHEFDAFAALVRNRGRILSLDELATAVWRDRPIPHRRSIRTLICDLRRKLDDDQRFPRYIVTARGGGYYVPGTAAVSG
jgi:DNA-binding response OmpR family regulator